MRSALSAWEKRGKYAVLNRIKVFFIDEGEREETLLVLHGYPSASYDYYKVIDQLKERFRVVIPDHPGFGFSGKPQAYSYSLIEQAESAIALCHQLGLKNIHLLGHDYGTSVANEILVRREQGALPFDVASVTLCNGSMHIELARLKLMQKIMMHPYWGPFAARFTNKTLLLRNMKDLWFDTSKFDPEEIDILWDLLVMNDGIKVFSKVSTYNHERRKYWHRWIGCLTRLDMPAHILWAQNDPVAVKAIGEQLYSEIPGAVITRLDHLGHYPMLEDPERWMSGVLSFYK